MGEKKDIIKKIKSIKEAIEEHLMSLEKELKSNDRINSYYHFKEILTSMFTSLLDLYKRLDKEEEGKIVIKNFLEKLEKLLKENNLFEEYKQAYLNRFKKYP